MTKFEIAQMNVKLMLGTNYKLRKENVTGKTYYTLNEIINKSGLREVESFDTLKELNEYLANNFNGTLQLREVNNMTKLIKLYTRDEYGDYRDEVTYKRIVELYGKLPITKKMIDNLISIDVNLRNDKMFLVVKSGRSKKDYSLDNIYGTWGNLTKYR